MTRATYTPHLLLLTKSPRLPVLAALAIAFAHAVTIWETRRRTRMHLKELDDHLLNDIGLTRDEARKEAKRPFWMT